MPLVRQSSYHRPPYWLFNAHAETVWPSMLRRVNGVVYERDTLELPDGDFLELDWVRTGSTSLAIVSHGLEGNTHRHYCTGMAKKFSQNGHDVLAWNCRSCGGTMNRLPRLYHHGATDDLDQVVQYALKKGYTSLTLVGFSLGGNLTLKWLGETTYAVPRQVKSAVAFSVPCNLAGCAAELNKSGKAFYRRRFLQKLRTKIDAKARQFPETIAPYNPRLIRTFEDFDNHYTAPIHGFKDAGDYYTRAASLQYLPAIAVPTLLVNAQNDPFLPPSCYPTALAEKHPWLSLEMPLRGGHVGFTLPGQNENWMEARALAFASEHL